MRSLVLPLLLSTAQALIVPSPPGPYSVAVKHFELVDRARKDILAPLPNTNRRFMSSVYLPVNAAYECKSQAEPYMPTLTAQVFGEMGEALGIPQGTLEEFEMDFCDLSSLTLNVDADSEKKKDSYPIAVFSPGYGGTRFVYGAMARSLASWGYIVFTLDHTWEAAVVEFPDGSDDYSTDLGLGNMTTTLDQLEVRPDPAELQSDQVSIGRGFQADRCCRCALATWLSSLLNSPTRPSLALSWPNSQAPLTPPKSSSTATPSAEPPQQPPPSASPP
jgi:hypothetical protein